MGDAPAKNALLRRLPAVERILTEVGLDDAIARYGRGLTTHCVRTVLDSVRRALVRDPDRVSTEDIAPARLAELSRRHLEREAPLPRVINATGVILHSGLGRAPLAPEAVAALVRAGTYSLLEVSREDARRLSRDTRAGSLLKKLTGAEASLVVNNNAAATLLILAALATGREVICSRGEMVEIGGSFRIPDVMEASGCRLVSVGTTNRTHVADYERAITDQTAALLVVHTSNYRICGFTATPDLSDVARVAHARGLPLIHDLGSGSLLSPEELGLGDEPPVRASLRSGADVVCMSGDKLLGGPQSGIILGRKPLVGLMRKHPLARALRVDKMTLAALEATLTLFTDPETLRQRHPVTRMLTTPRDELRPRAELLLSALAALPEVRARLVDSTAETGSGALPTLQIPSLAVAIDTPFSPDRLARALREESPALFSRIQDASICFDLRTLFPGEETEVAKAVQDAMEHLRESA